MAVKVIKKSRLSDSDKAKVQAYGKKKAKNRMAHSNPSTTNYLKPKIKVKPKDRLSIQDRLVYNTEGAKQKIKKTANETVKAKLKNYKDTYPKDGYPKAESKIKSYKSDMKQKNVKKSASDSIRAEQLKLWKSGAYGNISKAKAVDGFDGPMTRKARIANQNDKTTVTKVAPKKATIKVSAAPKLPEKETTTAKKKVVVKPAKKTTVTKDAITTELDKRSNPNIKSERTKLPTSKKNVRKAKRKDNRKARKAKRKMKPTVASVKNTSNAVKKMENRFNPLG